MPPNGWRVITMLAVALVMALGGGAYFGLPQIQREQSARSPSPPRGYHLPGAFITRAELDGRHVRHLQLHEQERQALKDLIRTLREDIRELRREMARWREQRRSEMEEGFRIPPFAGMEAEP